MAKPPFTVPYNYLPEQFADVQKFFALWEPLIRSGEFTLGPYVEEFETQFAQFVGSRHCISTNNGTDALILSLKSLGIGPGDDVITACNSFYATAGAIVAVGARPVFADVDSRYQLDVDSARSVLTERTRAILPVHWAGASPDMDQVRKFADSHGLYVVEDACMGIGGSIRGQHPGTFGQVGAFSMHPLKSLNVMGDGGMVVTDDDDLASWMRKYRNHGMIDRDHIEMWGVNMRLQPLQAVVASHILDQIPGIIAQRGANAAILDEALRPLAPHVILPDRRSDFTETYSLYIIQVDRRDELLTHLQDHSIDAKIHYPIPLHLQPATEGSQRSLPLAEQQANRIITLPIHQYLDEKQLALMSTTIARFFSPLTER